MKEFIKQAIKQTSQSVIIFTNHLTDEIVDPKIVYANQKFLDSTQFELKDLIGKNPSQFIRNGCKNTNIENIVQTIAGQNKSTWSGTLQMVVKNSKEFRTFILNIIPVVNYDHNTMFYACFGDLIEEYEANTDDDCDRHLDSFVSGLLEQANVFKDFTDQMPNGVWRCDTLGKPIYLNPIMHTVFGINKRMNMFKFMGESFETLARTRYEKLTFLNEKTNQWISCHVWPILQDGVIVGFCGTFKDVTNEHQMLTQLEEISTKGAV
jgi:PAS domain-containing protein